MQLLKYIPLQLTFFLILGILIGFYFSFTPQFVVISFAFLLVILLLFYQLSKKRLRLSVYYAIVAFFVFSLIGIGSSTFHNDLNNEKHYTSFLSEQDPVKAVLNIKTILKSNDYYNKYEARVLKINEQKAQGIVLINIRKDSLQKKLNIDNKLLVSTNFVDIDKPKNPYQFDYKKYLEKRNVYKQITISNSQVLLVANKQISIQGLAHKFREKVNEALLKNGFKDDELAIVNALLLGQRQEISKEIIENYSKAGAIHILAISGLHVGIILLLINFLLKPLEKLKSGKHIKLIITILLLWAFAFIAGMSASVVRAVTMFTALSIGLAANRKNSVYKNLIISVFFLLLVNPYYLFEVGFQLSYLAVFFIVWLQPLIYSIWKPKLKLIDYFWQLFTVSLAAQIGVLPLSLYYFHQFPGLFFVANLAIIPVLGIILSLGILVIFLSLLNILPVFLANYYQWFISLMNQLIAWVARQESFLFQDISFSIVLMLSTYFVAVFGFRWIENKTASRFKYVLFAVILVQGVFIFEKHKTVSSNEFIIFNKSKFSALAQKRKANLTINTSKELTISNSIFKNYIVGSAISKIEKIDSIKEMYQIKNKNLLVVDSLGIYKLNNFNPEMVLLSQSPKINLERLINELNPKIIIADASNYKSYVDRWKITCLNYNIKFHYTATDGAFIEKL